MTSKAITDAEENYMEFGYQYVMAQEKFQKHH